MRLTSKSTQNRKKTQKAHKKKTSFSNELVKNALFYKPVLNKNYFSRFSIKNYFSYKDPIPDDLKSFLVYKFTCASCSSSDIGETCRHFKTRIEEYIKKDNIYTPPQHVLTHIILFF